MATPQVIDCPTCGRKLRVPEEYLGQEVKCPTCNNTFMARDNMNAPPPPPPSRRAEPEEPPPSYRRTPRSRDDDDDDYDRDSRRRSRRSHLEPHRGSTIQLLGILSFFIAGFILGPMAWIMGNNDLRAMREGRMDPSGESETNTGRICGMISTFLHVGSLVIGLCCCGGSVLLPLITGGAAATTNPGGSRPPQRKLLNEPPLKLHQYLPSVR
jgi:predicted Zn finger-like uncharacterized protein